MPAMLYHGRKWLNAEPTLSYLAAETTDAKELPTKEGLELVKTDSNVQLEL